MRAEKNRRFK